MRTARRQPCVRNIDRESKSPRDIAMRRRKQRRNSPDNCGHRQANNPSDNYRSCRRQSSNPKVLQRENRTNSTIGCAKSSCVSATEPAGRVCGHHRDQKNLGDDKTALQRVIDCELGGEPRVAKPREKNQRQQEPVPKQTFEGVIRLERSAQLTDRSREDKVIEQLGPANPTNMLFVRGPKSWRSKNPRCNRWADCENDLLLLRVDILNRCCSGSSANFRNVFVLLRRVSADAYRADYLAFKFDRHAALQWRCAGQSQGGYATIAHLVFEHFARPAENSGCPRFADPDLDTRDLSVIKSLEK